MEFAAIGECSICQDLLTDDPDGDSTGEPSHSKRVRKDSTTISKDTPELCTTPCGHIFHKNCLLRWTKKQRQCPSCRRGVSPTFQVKAKRLTKIYLPLGESQCRNCVETMKQLKITVSDFVLEKDILQAREKKWKEQCIILEKKNAELRNELNLWRKQFEYEKICKNLLEFKTVTENFERQQAETRSHQQIMDFVNCEKQLDFSHTDENINLKQMALITEQQWDNLYQIALLTTEKINSQSGFETEGESRATAEDALMHEMCDQPSEFFGALR